MGCIHASSSVKIDYRSYICNEFDEGPDYETRRTGFMKNTTGSHNIFYRLWIPSNVQPVALVIGFHGILEHSGKYSKLAHEWTKKGVVVCFPDQEGHGKTEGGVRGDFVSIDGLVNNGYKLLYDILIPEFPNIPIFIFGHSMGSVVCTLLTSKIEKEGKSIAGYITSGLAIKPGPAAFRPLNLGCLYFLRDYSIITVLGNRLRSSNPTGPSSALQVEWCVRDKNILKLMALDPLTIHESVQNRAGFNTVESANELVTMAKDMKSPILCIHGDEDKVTLPIGTESYFNALKEGVDKEYYIVNGGYHETFYDTDASKHAQVALEWIIKHTSKKEGTFI